MNGICPHCGAKLPRVVDAFCPECREALDEPPEVYDQPASPPEMVGTVGEPPATVPAAPTVLRHTRLFMLAFYALAIVWGARHVWSGRKSPLDLIVPVASAVCLGMWAITDARLRRNPIPVLSRPWFFLLAGLLVPAYVVRSRGWCGAGWVLLHAALAYGVMLAAYYIVGFIVFGHEWLRALGLS